MKKTVYSLIALAALIVSCTAEKDFDQNFSGEVGELRLSVFSQDLVTRATEEGLDAYNENTIANYWYYIAADAAGANIITSGYVADGQPVTINMKQFEAQIPANRKCYVYIFANVPRTYTSDKTDINGNAITCTNLLLDKNGANYTITGNEKLSDLASLSLVSSFFDDYLDSRGRTGINGNIHADNEFVMWTPKYQKITLTGQAQTERIGLERVAAKVCLDLSIVKTIRQYQTSSTGADTYVKTWDAEYDKIQAYFLWASSYGNMDGEAVKYNPSAAAVAPSKYFMNYPRYAMFNTGYADGTLIPEIGEGNKTYDIWSL